MPVRRTFAIAFTNNSLTQRNVLGNALAARSAFEVAAPPLAGAWSASGW